jgi:hypothetical protein
LLSLSTQQPLQQPKKSKTPEENGGATTTGAVRRGELFCIPNIILNLLLFIRILTLFLFRSNVKGKGVEDGDEGGMDRGQVGEEEE